MNKILSEKLPAWFLVLMAALVAVCMIFLAPLFAIRCSDVRPIVLGGSYLLGGCLPKK